MANNQLLASDNFASGSLAAGWSAVFGQVTGVVVAGSPNVVEPPALSTGGDQIFTGITWPKDQTSEVTATVTGESGTFVVLWLRWQTGSYSGYQINITNTGAANSLQVFSYTNNVSTQIGSTVLGLTYAANDVWTASIAGSCISVYQNGNRVFFNFDTTWTSGSPGFGVFSSVNTTHVKVSAWRGYSVVQQDGIWQKRGVVIPALSTDTLASGIGAWINSAVLFEGNAQVLSGTVYKTWFSAGNNIGYAESLDGKNWTRRAGSVITGFSVPMVLKVGTTYYLIAQIGAGGNTNFNAFTSTDGINWTNHGDTGIHLGTGGAWDSAFQYSLQPVAIINGTWFGLYTAGNSATTILGSLGGATSPDGLNWTKSGSNPLVSNFWNSQAITKVGSTWYMWGESNSPGRGNAGAPGLDPTETVRMQSTDLINWTSPVHSLHNSQMHESLNASSGQSFPNAIIDIGGKAYLYHTVDPSDNLTPHVYQIGLSIAPAPIASVVTQNEDAAQQIASDAFTSGIGNLSLNWTTPTGATKLQIVAGNLVEASATSTTCGMFYSGSTFASAQYSEVTIQTLATGNFALPAVWMQSGSFSDYEVNIQGPTGSLVSLFQIFKRVSGTRTAIGPLQAITLQVGDVIRLSVFMGGDGFPVLSAYQNGYLVQQVQDYSNALSSGAPGMIEFATALTSAQISLWAGGNANVIPLYPSGCGSAYSVPDCRVAPAGPNASRCVNGTATYDVQTSSNAVVPGVDSRVQGAPVDSRITPNIPLNSRTPGTFGPGVS